MINNINYTLHNNLCTGCGICEDVCPAHAIIIKRIRCEYRPVLDKKICLGEKCGRCLKVCPGVGCKLDEMSKNFFNTDNEKTNRYIGRYYSLHTGYSLDNEIRLHSASGGMVSQFLIYLLDKKIIDGAVVTGFSEDNITPFSYIARTKEDVLRAKSSKYCPVALNKVGNEIKNSEGKYVIVGLPCHIQGFRKRAQTERKFREKVIGYFSIYCSSNRTFNAQDYLFRKYKVNKDEIKYFAFRDNGCLGDMVIGDKAGRQRGGIPFIRYYGALRSFFKPRRCLTCIDHYGELADVCFGDIHIKHYSDDKIGISSWIVRNPYFEDLFRSAAKEGYIKMDNMDAHTLNESQKAMLYPKKRKAKALMNIDKTLGKATAKYEVKLDKPGIKDYLSVIIINAQRFIGKHTSLWFIVDFFYNRNINKIRRER